MISAVGSGPSAFAVSTIFDELSIEFEILDVGDLPNRNYNVYDRHLAKGKCE
jgi:hypothetical protein